MNIALVIQHKLLQGLQRLLQGCAPTSTPPALPASTAARTPALPAACTPGLQALAQPGLRSSRPAPKTMPLRVVRVVERGQSRACTGRLVISGRMADVCAELDRLVEREAALSH